ncbi:NAD(P)H-hydrate epimerase [Oribacterium sp. Sow4_G1_1]|uniref:NAD(P)H-hydrate epimerase n=1 Tax=Oribacterium sp. Sow4_G1_1 TaxID=3438794 RepID=UPI003F97A57E
MQHENGNRKAMCITGTVAKAADRYAMDVMGLKSLTLMETASSKIAEYVMKHFPLAQKRVDATVTNEVKDALAELVSLGDGVADVNGVRDQQKPAARYQDLKISVLCGVGNNGADGVCASRMLLEEGYQPQVYIVGNLEKASWEFLYQLCHFQQAGGTVTMYHPDVDTANAGEVAVMAVHPGVNAGEATVMAVHPGVDTAGAGEAAAIAVHPDSATAADDASLLRANRLPDDDILIDGIFGIGLHREIAGDYRAFIEEANRRRHGFVLAIDTPSGINTDTGELMGCGIKADVTITFGRNKTGLVCGAGQNFAGRVLVEDIGIPDEAYEEAERHA